MNLETTTAKKTRKFKRIKITAISKLNNKSCSVINISREGMMLCGNWKSTEKIVDIQLKIGGRWIFLKGKIMWSMDGNSPKLKRVGVYIIQAPPEYGDFIDNLYLEADEKI
jgi:hypothetical protein